MNAQEIQSIETEKITSYHVMLFAICFLSNVFGGTTSTLMSVYLPVAVVDFAGEVDSGNFRFVSAYVSAIFIFGWAIGGISWGILSDKIGRTKALIFSIGCYGLFTLLTGFTDSWIWVLVCRLLTGFGVGGVLVVTPTLLSEVWPVATRTIFIGILSIGFPVGIFSAGMIDFFVTDWHDAFIVGLFPFALGLLSIKLSESEKWSATRSDVGERKTKVKLDKQLLSDLLIGSLTFGAMLIGLWAIFSWLPSWIQTLSLSGSQSNRGLAMMGLGAGGLAGGFFSGWLAKAMGHRRSMILCFAACFIMSFLLFKLNKVMSEIVYVEIALLAIFFGASQGILSAYIPEMFNPAIRATATGICFNIGRLVTAPVVFFVGALVVFFGDYGNAIFIFSWVFVVGLMAAFFSKKL